MADYQLIVPKEKLQKVLTDEIKAVREKKQKIRRRRYNKMVQNFSFNELVSYLKDMNKEYGSLSYYLFAIKYGESLKDKNLTEIIRSAGLTKSMSKELSKGLRLYKVLKSNDFEIDKSDIQNPNTRINYSLSDLANILYQMESNRNENGIGATATAFGFKYGKAISENLYSCGSIIDEAKRIFPDFSLTHTHDATMKYGVDLYNMFKNKSFGLSFSRRKAVYKLLSNCINSSTLYLTALRTKPFMLLAGISGTGKSRIVRKLAQATVTEELQRAEGYVGTDFANDRWTLHSPANFELIQVSPTGTTRWT